MCIKIGHNLARDAEAGIDVVTAVVGSGDGVSLFVTGKIVPQAVIGDGIRG